MNPEPPIAPLPTLLIADDHTSILATLEFILAGAYRVLRAENGIQAVATARVSMVDGALIDLHMPGLSGIETCRQLRALARERGRSWPIWIMSAALSTEARRAAVDAGACGFFEKPFPIDLKQQVTEEISRIPAQATGSS